MDGHFPIRKGPSVRLHIAKRRKVEASNTEDTFIDAAYMALQSGMELQRAIEILGEVAQWKEENWGVTH